MTDEEPARVRSPYEEGTCAASAGEPHSASPYKAGTSEWKAWQHGHFHAWASDNRHLKGLNSEAARALVQRDLIADLPNGLEGWERERADEAYFADLDATCRDDIPPPPTRLHHLHSDATWDPITGWSNRTDPPVFAPLGIFVAGGTIRVGNGDPIPILYNFQQAVRNFIAAFASIDFDAVAEIIHGSVGVWQDGDPPPNVRMIAGRPAGRVKHCAKHGMDQPCSDCSKPPRKRTR